MKNAALVLVGLFAAAPASAAALDGTVLETLDAGDYTYLSLKTASGPQWAAVGKTDLKPGDRAEVAESVVMEDYQSPSLKRRFSKVVFGVLVSPRAKAGPQGSPAPAPELKPVPRPTGPALPVSIAELYARRKELRGKLVRVKGKVAKSNANILGRTWLHLRDGSGSDKGRDNDLVLTTRGSAAVGEDLSAVGVVSLERDLGAGYAFPVLLEDADLAGPTARR